MRIPLKRILGIEDSQKNVWNKIWNDLKKTIDRNIQTIITQKKVLDRCIIILGKSFLCYKPLLRFIEKEFQEKGESYLNEKSIEPYPSGKWKIKLILKEDQEKTWQIEVNKSDIFKF